MKVVQYFTSYHNMDLLIVMTVMSSWPVW